MVADLGALFLRIKNIFSLFFEYYSKNFNNYKIIEKILNNNKAKISNQIYDDNIKYIELKNFINDSLDSESDIHDKIIEKKLIINNNEINNNSIEIINNDIKETNYDSKKLKKISFFQFLLNNINFRSCLKNEEQKIISICNEILLKYFSVDHIIYYQMKLENLFKDYKWNNPKLNEISSNEYINKIKNI